MELFLFGYAAEYLLLFSVFHSSLWINMLFMCLPSVGKLLKVGTSSVHLFRVLLIRSTRICQALKEGRDRVGAEDSVMNICARQVEGQSE